MLVQMFSYLYRVFTSLICRLACPEAVHLHTQPDQMGVLHGRDPVHRTLVRLEDAGRAHRELWRAGHHRHQQEEDRLALLQQRSPRPTRRHHQTTGCKSGLTCSPVFLLLLFTTVLNSKHYSVFRFSWMSVFAGHWEVGGRAWSGAWAMACHSGESTTQCSGWP